MDTGKSPLYRKVNTLARGVRHDFGGDFRHERQGKRGVDPENTRGAMHGKHRRGLDYTPLFRFLLSKVGQDWTGLPSIAKRVRESTAKSRFSGWSLAAKTTGGNWYARAKAAFIAVCSSTKPIFCAK